MNKRIPSDKERQEQAIDQCAEFMDKLHYSPDYETFCTVMYDGKMDYYTEGKFESFKRNAINYYYGLDSLNRRKFISAILTTN
jgi:hypothetical protein